MRNTKRRSNVYLHGTLSPSRQMPTLEGINTRIYWELELVMYSFLIQETWSGIERISFQDWNLTLAVVQVLVSPSYSTAPHSSPSEEHLRPQRISLSALTTPPGLSKLSQPDWLKEEMRRCEAVCPTSTTGMWTVGWLVCLLSLEREGEDHVGEDILLTAGDK